MPTYQYRCQSCEHELELFQGITEAPKKKCPACKRRSLKRVIGPGAGLIFKGSGFYLTDYRSDSYKKAAEAEKKGESPSSGAGDKAPESKSPEKKTPEKKTKEEKKGKDKGKSSESAA